MGGTLEGLPTQRIGEAVVGAAVQHQGLLPQFGREWPRGPVRQSQYHHIMAGQGRSRGGLQHPVGQRRQVWLVHPQAISGRGMCGERPDLYLRVVEQQPQHLTTGVTGGPGDSN